MERPRSDRGPELRHHGRRGRGLLLGILALSRREAAQDAVRSGIPGAGSGNLALAGAALSFSVCASVVFYGITMIAGH
ncbi:hypothetical protein GCM10025734_53980 [Kitasatospora paranensis]|uniref:hypothetical protein n=1 Tax=Kitasatospora paranensis TaxID=258053 RepID=UPI0031EF4F27